jgi:DNA invertase Pin-like site-specific DNA recombinase
VSREEQARPEKTSIDDQRRALQLLSARLRRVLDDALVFEDPGVSGGSDNRPGFQEMLRYCEAHRRHPRNTGCLLVLNHSRWGRWDDPEDDTYWRGHFKRLGWFVRFAEGDEAQDPFTRILSNSVGSMSASQYRRDIKANAKRGARGTAMKGLWQNEAPIGYRRQAFRSGSDPEVLQVGQQKAKDQQVRLTPGPPEEQELVKWLFESYASGTHSLSSLARAALVRWPRKQWGKQVVRQMLTNRTYLGDVVWCRRPHDPDERALTPVRPADQHIVVQDAHEALVTRAQFETVQARLAANRKQTRAVQGAYPLSGLLTCAHCGKHYTGGGRGSNPKNIGNDPSRYAFYKCSGSSGTLPTCGKPIGTVKKRWIESVVVGEIGKVLRRPGVRQAIEEELDRVLGGLTTSVADQRSRLNAECDRLSGERKRLASAITKGVLSESDAGQESARIKAEWNQVEDARQRLAFSSRSAASLRGERARLLRLAEDFQGAAAAASGATLRQLIQPWLEGCVVDKHKRTVELAIRRVPTPPSSLHLATLPGRG